jgi:hypothetical protein
MINLKTDWKARFTMIFIIVLGVLVIIASPTYWPYVVGYWAIVVLIAYLKRNSP